MLWRQTTGFFLLLTYLVLENRLVNFCHLGTYIPHVFLDLISHLYLFLRPVYISNSPSLWKLHSFKHILQPSFTPWKKHKPVSSTQIAVFKIKITFQWFSEQTHSAERLLKHLHQSAALTESSKCQEKMCFLERQKADLATASAWSLFLTHFIVWHLSL